MRYEFEPSARRREGFTLIEILVVIGIIAVLIGILIPVISKAREQAKRSVCLSNQHQLTVSCITYSLMQKQYLPPRYFAFNPYHIRNWAGDGLVLLALFSVVLLVFILHNLRGTPPWMKWSLLAITLAVSFVMFRVRRRKVAP